MKGTIEKAGKGKYRLRYPIGTLSNGNANRLSKTVEAKNDKEAYMELAKWNLEIEKKGYTSLDKITLENFVESFWKKEAKLNLEERTFEEYETIVEQRFINKLGNKRLAEIKPYEIKDILIKAKRLDKKEAELSRQRKKRILSALSNVFIVARDEYRIVQSNPCNDVRLPKEKNAKKNVYPPYSVDEIQILFNKLKEAPLRTQAIIMTAITTGAREGEIAALEEHHFNFETNEILFNQRIIATKDGLIRKDGLKATDSKKMIVPEEYMQTMKRFISENKEVREKLRIDTVEHSYIFGTPEGKPVTPISLNRHWRRWADKNDMRYIRFHDFRHTAATFLIAQNTPLKNVQERLGHKDYNTTINIYSHALQEIDKKSSDELAQFFK